MPYDVYFDLGKLQRPSQKDHKVRVFDPADPDFLVVDHIIIARAFATVLRLLVWVPVLSSVTAMDCRRGSPKAIFGRYYRFHPSEPWHNKVPMLYICP